MVAHVKLMQFFFAPPYFLNPRLIVIVNLDDTLYFRLFAPSLAYNGGQKSSGK